MYRISYRFLGPGWSAKPLVSAHDRIMGTHRSQFLQSQAAVACDFATIDTVTLRRLHLLSCIDIATRTVYFAGITDHPRGVWASQAARNLLLPYGHRLADAAALVRDRASPFRPPTDSQDAAHNAWSAHTTAFSGTHRRRAL